MYPIKIIKNYSKTPTWQTQKLMSNIKDDIDKLRRKSLICPIGRYVLCRIFLFQQSSLGTKLFFCILCPLYQSDQLQAN